MKSGIPQKEKYFRAEKSTKSKDDYKVLLVGICAALLIIGGQYAFAAFSEHRWFRDFTKQTPFYDVSVSQVILDSDKKEITIRGYMVKRRCEFVSLTGYVIDTANDRHRVYVDSTPEDLVTGMPPLANRPPSQKAEVWGPWVINFSFDVHDPKSWEVWAHHKCPNFATTQSNLFAKGPWVTQLGVEP